MPLYMDRHDLPGLTAEGIAEAHQMDLGIQTQYGCHAMTYWVDSDRGYVFCLIDAPSIQAVIEMHNNSHGKIPHEIKEVNSDVVKAFLGRIHDPQPDPGKDKDSVLIITETAFRAIMITDIRDRSLLASQFSPEFSNSIQQTFHEQIRQLAQEHNGAIVDNQNEFILSFNSVSNAMECALALQEIYHVNNPSHSNPKVDIQTGISAGIPVTQNANLFGDTVKTARTLGCLSGLGIVNISSNIREMYKGQYPDKINASSRVRSYAPNEVDFLNKLIDAIDHSISGLEFKLDDICKKLSLSKSSLYRKIVNLSGLSPNDFIMEIRLRKSIEWMQTRKANISETAYELGFANPSYFSKCFKKRFGILPADFLKSLG